MGDNRDTIMIIDDTVANLQLLEVILSRQGFKTRCFPDPKLALKIAKKSPPDLILLDINMPEVDGYQVCQQLKQIPDLAEIPVIFLSALSTTFDKVKAFEVGAVDYVAKPFQLEELKARVETHLKVSRVTKELENSYSQLKQLENMREHLMHMLVHDMQQPLGVVAGFLQLLIAKEELSERGRRYIDNALGATDQIQKMIDELLLIRRLEESKLPLKWKDISVIDLLNGAVSMFEGNDREVRVELVLTEQLSTQEIRGDEDLINRILGNFISNALSFTSKRGVVHLRTEERELGLRFFVEDRGPGIPEAARLTIFEKFKQVEDGPKRAKRGTGLGLNFCKLAVEAHCGQLGVIDREGGGSSFWFEIPWTQTIGTQTIGTQTIGPQTIGSQAMGKQATGTEAKPPTKGGFEGASAS